MSESDVNLVHAALAGDMQAFGHLVRRYQDTVHGFVLHKIGDFAEAQDIAQEVFLEAYTGLTRLKSPEKFPAWLRGIAANVCRMWYRQHRTRVSLEHPDAQAALAQQAPATPDELYEAEEQRQQVLDALNHLSDKNRLTVTLYYLDGLSQEQISRFLEISVSTVETRLYRARHQLREGMMKMIAETLTHNKLPEEFSNKVVAELLAKPRLLEMPDHPLTQMWHVIQDALPEYTVLEPGEEIESIDLNQRILGEDYLPQEIIRVDDTRMLRVHTTTRLLAATRDQSPPQRLLTAGRVFRDATVDARHYPVFHQIEGLWLDAEADEAMFRASIECGLRAALGDVSIRWRDAQFPFTEPAWEADVSLDDAWMEVLGAGRMTPMVLEFLGHDPSKVACYGFGMGLERLVMLRHSIADIRDFWRA